MHIIILAVLLIQAGLIIILIMVDNYYDKCLNICQKRNPRWCFNDWKCLDSVGGVYKPAQDYKDMMANKKICDASSPDDLKTRDICKCIDVGLKKDPVTGKPTGSVFIPATPLPEGDASTDFGVSSEYHIGATGELTDPTGPYPELLRYCLGTGESNTADTKP